MINDLKDLMIFVFHNRLLSNILNINSTFHVCRRCYRGLRMDHCHCMVLWLHKSAQHLKHSHLMLLVLLPSSLFHFTLPFPLFFFALHKSLLSACWYFTNASVVFSIALFPLLFLFFASLAIGSSFGFLLLGATICEDL